MRDEDGNFHGYRGTEKTTNKLSLEFEMSTYGNS
jgi:hypothetical protein